MMPEKTPSQFTEVESLEDIILTARKNHRGDDKARLASLGMLPVTFSVLFAGSVYGTLTREEPPPLVTATIGGVTLAVWYLFARARKYIRDKRTSEERPYIERIVQCGNQGDQSGARAALERLGISIEEAEQK